MCGKWADGMLTLPIYGKFSPTSTLNIVPGDWAARMLSRLVDVSVNGQVFHVVHPRPPKIRWLNDASLRHMGIADFRYGDFPGYDPKSLLGKFQKLFDRSTAQYLPYITREARFVGSNLPSALGKDYVPPADIDEAFVAKLMDYAKCVNFGKD